MTLIHHSQQSRSLGPRQLVPAVAALALIAGATAWAGAHDKSAKKVKHVDAARAEYKEIAPGVSKAALWGNDRRGPYGSFTKFTPGQRTELHTHTNDLKIVVLEGAYIYQPEAGASIRVGRGEFLMVPGGTRHVSSADPDDGALFYEESQGKFDLRLIQPRVGERPTEPPSTTARAPEAPEPAKQP